MFQDFKFLNELKETGNALMDDDSLFGYEAGTKGKKARNNLEDSPSVNTEKSSIEDNVHDKNTAQLENNFETLNQDMHIVNIELKTLKSMLLTNNSKQQRFRNEQDMLAFYEMKAVDPYEAHSAYEEEKEIERESMLQNIQKVD